VEEIFAKLGAIPDPRADNCRHKLPAILFFALAATLCGARSCEDMADYAAEMDFLVEGVLELEHGTPSHDTFSRIFQILDPAEFGKAFQILTESFAENIPGGPPPDGIKVVAVDGKALKRAFAAGERAQPTHLVNAWSEYEHLCLAQSEAPGRNEVEGAIDLVGRLDLLGTIVTADALHCHKRFAAAILERNGGFALALKGNRSKLLEDAKQRLSSADAETGEAVVERGHGRTEGRRATVVRAEDFSEKHDFPGVYAIAKIDAWRHDGEKETVNTRYYLLSEDLRPDQVLRVVRAHWSVENNLHWMLDVYFGEDQARNRIGSAATNLAALRRLALNILKADPLKASAQRKMRKASWNKDYLLTLLQRLGQMR